jgi:hypothetical protein
VRKALLVLCLSSCGGSSGGDAGVDLSFCGPPFEHPPAVCDDAHPLIGTVTDPGICGPDPVCGLIPPVIGEGCTFPGVICLFAGVSVRCDCRGIAHCSDTSGNPGAFCPVDMSTTD